MADYVAGKDKYQILKEMVGTSNPQSPVHEQQKMGIIVRCSEDLEASIGRLVNSMNRNAESSNYLGIKVFWLNVVIGIATLVATIVSVSSFFIDK